MLIKFYSFKINDFKHISFRFDHFSWCLGLAARHFGHPSCSQRFDSDPGTGYRRHRLGLHRHGMVRCWVGSAVLAFHPQSSRGRLLVRPEAWWSALEDSSFPASGARSVSCSLPAGLGARRFCFCLQRCLGWMEFLCIFCLSPWMAEIIHQRRSQHPLQPSCRFHPHQTDRLDPSCPCCFGFQHPWDHEPWPCWESPAQ